MSAAVLGAKRAHRASQVVYGAVQRTMIGANRPSGRWSSSRCDLARGTV